MGSLNLDKLESAELINTKGIINVFISKKRKSILSAFLDSKEEYIQIKDLAEKVKEHWGGNYVQNVNNALSSLYVLGLLDRKRSKSKRNGTHYKLNKPRLESIIKLISELNKIA